MNSKDMKYYRDKFIDTFPEKDSFYYTQWREKKISAYGCKRYNAWFDYYTDDTVIEPKINEGQLVRSRLTIHDLIKQAIDYHKGESQYVVFQE